jgi:hypothetical protein
VGISKEVSIPKLSMYFCLNRFNHMPSPSYRRIFHYINNTKLTYTVHEVLH